MGYAEGSSTPQGREKRDEILDAAMVEFTRHGYMKASLSKIAARANISKSGLLHHFTEKSALLDAVLSERTFLRRHPDRAREVNGVLEFFALNAEVNESDEDWARFRTIMVAESLTDDHPALPSMQLRYRDLIDDSSGELRANYPGITKADADAVSELAIAVLDGLEMQLALIDNRDMGKLFALFRDMADEHLKRRMRGE